MSVLQLLFCHLVVGHSLVGLSEANFWALNLAIVANRVGEDGICDPSALSSTQERICEGNRDVVYTIAQGVEVGLAQCQDRFVARRWNCSVQPAHFSYFLTATQQDTPEAAYVQAITGAGMMSAVSRQCKRNQLQKCSCDSTPKTPPPDRSFFWGGCGDNHDYGYTFSKQFSAGAVQSGTALSVSELMSQHNSEAGRMIVQDNLRIQCRCHGLTGSCNVKTCWLSLPDFDEVGAMLLRKYDKAVKVQKSASSSDLVSADSRALPLEDSDLVFVEEPPSYCDQDVSAGSLGTRGRECKPGSTGLDSCDSMCCSRGYHTERVITTSDCNCRFIYCCYTECETCTVVEFKHYCN